MCEQVWRKNIHSLFHTLPPFVWHLTHVNQEDDTIRYSLCVNLEAANLAAPLSTAFHEPPPSARSWRVNKQVKLPWDTLEDKELDWPEQGSDLTSSGRQEKCMYFIFSSTSLSDTRARARTHTQFLINIGHTQCLKVFRTFIVTSEKRCSQIRHFSLQESWKKWGKPRGTEKELFGFGMVACALLSAPIVFNMILSGVVLHKDEARGNC